MKIIINDHRKIFGIQKEFSKHFPNLRLEFFAKPHGKNSEASEHMVLHSSKTIGQCRSVHKKGTITLSQGMTAADIKEHLSDVFGLTAKLLRKTKNDWREIPIADKQTLAEQNKVDLG